MTSPSVFSSSARFCVIFAPPSMAHCPNKVFSAATLRSSGILLMAWNTDFSVPMPSLCMDLAMPSAVKPSSSHMAFCAFVALDPLLMFV